MCDPITLMTSAAAAASTALGVVQQVQRAQAQQPNYIWHDPPPPDPAAAFDEQRARLAEQEGAAAVGRAQAKTAQQLGSAQARLAAQGSDLAGSPLDVIGDIAAAGEEDALSLRYQAMRTAWENRARAAQRPQPTGYFERIPAGRVDPTLGIVRGLLT